MNKLTTLELLDFVLESIQIVRRSFEGIDSSDAFLSNDENLTKLDAILMRLQASGEALKNLDKRARELLLQVAPKEYWSDMRRFRDLVSHHYTDLQADAVFDICANELDEFEEKIKKLKESI